MDSQGRRAGGAQKLIPQIARMKNNIVLKRIYMRHTLDAMPALPKAC